MAKTSAHRILVIAGAAIIPLVGIVIASMFPHITIPEMTRDVTAIAGIHPFSGVLSSLGILFWWTSATVWLFTASLRRVGQETNDLGFLAYFGFLSAYLGLDDLFQFHEYLVPAYLKVPERAAYGLLALAIALVSWRYRHHLHRPDGVLLLLALAFLSGSVVVDAASAPWPWHLIDWAYFVEDGLKWLGVCFWTAFCLVRCAADLNSLKPQEDPHRRAYRNGYSCTQVCGVGQRVPRGHAMDALFAVTAPIATDIDASTRPHDARRHEVSARDA